MRQEGKIVNLGYFILSNGFDESEYHLLLINLNPTYKLDLISV